MDQLLIYKTVGRYWKNLAVMDIISQWEIWDNKFTFCTPILGHQWLTDLLYLFKKKKITSLYILKVSILKSLWIWNMFVREGT